MNDAPENQDVSFEQELEAAFARMFRPEEAVNAQAWVNWLNQVRPYMWHTVSMMKH
jgi:hypothetical protein